MCELYVLSHFREAVAEAKIAEAVGAAIIDDDFVETVEELMDDAKTSMKALSERTAKLALDLAFIQIERIYNNDAAQERLLRYAGEMCRKLEHDLDVDKEIV
ncbi:MAG: hypothetical protein V3T23_05970 [Nitrososphaerales archaeon]